MLVLVNLHDRMDQVWGVMLVQNLHLPFESMVTELVQIKETFFGQVFSLYETKRNKEREQREREREREL